MRQPKPWYRKQTKSWYVQIGKEQINLGRDKRVARATYHELMSEARDPDPRAEDAVVTLMERYLNWCSENRAPLTCKKNRLHLERFIQSLSPDLPISQLKPLHVQRWLDAYYAGASDTYKHTAITVVKAAINWAVDQGYIDRNPIARMKKPKPAIRDFFVRSPEWPRVLAAASGRAFKDFVTVMFSSGARPQELRRVESRHFDPQRQRFVFSRDESKGKTSQRIIYLDDVAYAIVERLAKEHPTGPLFRNSRGTRWTRHALNGRFRRLKVLLGMPKLCAYSLRHSYAHWKVTSGTDSYAVGKLLGHADGRMLETRYAHAEEDAAFMLAAARESQSPLADTTPSEQDIDECADSAGQFVDECACKCQEPTE